MELKLSMAIPKTIHYVWVGGGQKSKTILRCMKTWKKHLNEYEIIEWNEENFDIDSNPYAKQAYEQKKWAFVSDFIRAHVVYEYGGIYLDTDVLVLDDLKHLLKNRAFVGFENEKYPFTAVFGAEPQHPLLKDMLELYEETGFVYNKTNELSQTNTRTVSDILINKYKCETNNRYQLLREEIAVYPDHILCNPSESSSAIHVFTGTWLENNKGFARKVVMFIKKRLTTKKRAKLYERFTRKKV